VSTERLKIIVSGILDGKTMGELEAVLVKEGQPGASSTRNLIRATRAVLVCLAEAEVIPPLKVTAKPVLSPEERKARAKARREQAKAKKEAERKELEDLRAKLAATQNPQPEIPAKKSKKS
jgi:hypothetical protein